MRVTDDRYTRDRLRLDLAVRLIRLEARTQTIRIWTGLTDDRIRKLYRSYLADCAGPPVTRHRGKSPQQASYFTRSAQLRQETGSLAALLTLYGALPRQRVADSARALPSLARGELLCRAYETYAALHAPAAISFEHAVFLLLLLARGDELHVQPCAACRSLGIVDRLAPRAPRCLCCDSVLGPGLRERAAAAESFLRAAEPRGTGGRMPM